MTEETQAPAESEAPAEVVEAPVEAPAEAPVETPTKDVEALALERRKVADALNAASTQGGTAEVIADLQAAYDALGKQLEGN